MYVNFLKTIIGLVATAVIQKEQYEELHLPELNKISKVNFAYLAPQDNFSCVPNCSLGPPKMQNKAVSKTKLV